MIGPGHDVHRDMAGRHVGLEAVEHGKPGLIRQADIENDRAGLVLPRQLERLFGRTRDKALKAHFMGKVTHDAGEAFIVFDDEQ